MVNQGASKDSCPRCVKGKMVTDNESGEMFCSKCGFVMSEKIPRIWSRMEIIYAR